MNDLNHIGDVAAKVAVEARIKPVREQIWDARLQWRRFATRFDHDETRALHHQILTVLTAIDDVWETVREAE